MHAVGRTCGGTLQAPADPAAQASKVLAPVLARPDLEPVDDESVPATPRGGRGEYDRMAAEGVNDVVAATVTNEVSQYSCREHESRSDSAPPSFAVQVHRAADGEHSHAPHVRLASARPLAKRQVCDVVPGGGQPLRERAVPPLRSSDGQRVEAVVRETDSHRSR